MAQSDPTGPFNTSQARRADVLLAWQTTCDDRINKLLVLILTITLFYVYYGIVSPSVAKARLDAMNGAKADLDPIIEQFQQLRNRYIDFVSPVTTDAPHDASNMGLFVDKIIPAIHTQDPTKKELHLLRRLNNDMAILSRLHKLHFQVHPTVSGQPEDHSGEQFRLQLSYFRRALGIILSGDSNVDNNLSEASRLRRNGPEVQDVQAALDLRRFLSGGRTHIDAPNDPVNNLERLRELETAIQGLIELENDPSEDRLLADKARDALSLDARAAESIRVGDTITRSFPAYQGLAKYAQMNIEERALRYSGGTDIGAYRRISELLNPPFEVVTIADLQKMKWFADSETDRMSAEQRAPMLHIPFLNVSIDRNVVLLVTPTFLVLLLHLLASNVQRSFNLTRELHNDQTNSLKKSDYSQFAPYHLLMVAPEAAGESTNAAMPVWRQLALTIRRSIGFVFAQAVPLLVPLSVILTFLVSVRVTRTTSRLTSFIFWSLYALTSVVILAESVIIFRLLRIQHSELKASAVTNFDEGDPHAQT
jgi:hypothetical protein